MGPPSCPSLVGQVSRCQRCDLRPSPRVGALSRSRGGQRAGVAAPSHAHGHPWGVLQREEAARRGGLSSRLGWDPPPPPPRRKGDWEEQGRPGEGRGRAGRDAGGGRPGALGGRAGAGVGGEWRKGFRGRPPHLARRGHGLALAPRPPRRGLPARPLRPDAAAGGESTQSLTLSLGNGCRKVPAAAISPSSRGVPGALLRPATAPGEL